MLIVLNKINKTKVIEKLTYDLLIEIFKILCLCICHIHSKEKTKTIQGDKFSFKRAIQSLFTDNTI